MTGNFFVPTSSSSLQRSAKLRCLSIHLLLSGEAQRKKRNTYYSIDIDDQEILVGCVWAHEVRAMKGKGWRHQASAPRHTAAGDGALCACVAGVVRRARETTWRNAIGLGFSWATCPLEGQDEMRVKDPNGNRRPTDLQETLITSYHCGAPLVLPSVPSSFLFRILWSLSSIPRHAIHRLRSRTRSQPPRRARRRLNAMGSSRMTKAPVTSAAPGDSDPTQNGKGPPSGLRLARPGVPQGSQLKQTPAGSAWK